MIEFFLNAIWWRWCSCWRHQLLWISNKNSIWKAVTCKFGIYTCIFGHWNFWWSSHWLKALIFHEIWWDWSSHHGDYYLHSTITPWNGDICKLLNLRIVPPIYTSCLATKSIYLRIKTMYWILFISGISIYFWAFNNYEWCFCRGLHFTIEVKGFLMPLWKTFYQKEWKTHQMYDPLSLFSW